LSRSSMGGGLLELDGYLIYQTKSRFESEAIFKL
jgi:hypothetical protein